MHELHESVTSQVILIIVIPVKLLMETCPLIKGTKEKVNAHHSESWGDGMEYDVKTTTTTVFPPPIIPTVVTIQFCGVS